MNRQNIRKSRSKTPNRSKKKNRSKSQNRGKGINKKNENTINYIKINKDDYTKYYEVKGMISKGHFGVVYKGINRESREKRAIKIIDSEFQNFDYKKYLKNELNSLNICSQQNQNSIKYYENFYFQKKFVIVMELCDSSLQKKLDRQKKGFTCEQIYEIMSQLNNTFKIMNENKIVHRDIKLDNILIKNKYNKNKNAKINFIVKLGDYGISKQLINTVNKTFIGTIETMAPEVLEGKSSNDNKCDLWSIGIIIYQLFFNEYPYKGKTQVEIHDQIKEDGTTKLKKTNNENLDNLIKLLLNRDPKKRINYEDYFNHPFFKKNNNNTNINKTNINKININETNIKNTNINKTNKNINETSIKNTNLNETNINMHETNIKNTNINKNINNYIECEIKIEEENKDIRIINSYEHWYENYGYVLDEFKEEYCNEKEIKENCEIRINDEIIPFTYFYKFKNKGKYNIKYSFKNYLTNTNYMFFDCKSLININLSNLNTQNVTNMGDMFSNCSSLANINLSNLNTQNVTNMGFMFYYCSSLTNINLYNFDTSKVNDMSHMFSYCTSLENINMPNINTQNVTNMSHMFDYCTSLKDINLSSFNTQNVINMKKMFSNCTSLISLNLSNFSTQNVINVNDIFSNCSSLKSIDLSNFNTQNIIEKSNMFTNCKFLKSDKIIINDKYILNISKNN